MLVLVVLCKKGWVGSKEPSCHERWREGDFSQVFDSSTSRRRDEPIAEVVACGPCLYDAWGCMMDPHHKSTSSLYPLAFSLGQNLPGENLQDIYERIFMRGARHLSGVLGRLCWGCTAVVQLHIPHSHPAHRNCILKGLQAGRQHNKNVCDVDVHDAVY